MNLNQHSLFKCQVCFNNLLWTTCAYASVYLYVKLEEYPTHKALPLLKLMYCFNTFLDQN